MNTTLNASSSSSNSRSRSIVTRIASSLSSTPRNITDFYIHLNDLTRSYSPDDSVRGEVRLTVQKPTRITHLVISLHGFIKVYKNPTLPGQGVPAEVKTPSAGRGRTGHQYHGNGLLSLFEDEVILAGEGRLVPGKYTFTFESQFLPSRLPSSLDFERGTISYVLVATVTRPTTISPTLICEKKLSFVETIDVAHLTIPKPRTITLTPLTKTPKPRTPVSKASHESKDSSASASASPRDSVAAPSVDTNAVDAGAAVDSAISEGSTVSAPSSSLSFQIAQCSRNTAPGEIRASAANANPRVITVSVEVLKGGCLAGDLIPLRIWIKHIRPVTSMHGVIVTLYRKARIDPNPIFRPGVSNTKKDDVLPRSRTGLGGLSLARSSCHIFRMDLAQTFAPLVVNPATLEADIKTSVPVPEDIFPTIVGIPGDMITFTYHVEVVTDLVEKLANQDRFFPRISMTNQTPAFSLGSKPSFAGYGNQSSLETYRLIDTTEIRREKGITECTFEITIGTKNSKQANPQRPQQPPGFDTSTVETETRNPVSNSAASESHADSPDQEAINDPPFDPDETIRPPPLEEPADEKARLRLRELQLLPSRPPDSDEDPSSASSSIAPSAPTLDALAPGFTSLTSLQHQSNTLDRPQPAQEQEALELLDGEEESAPAYEHEGETETSTSASTATIGARGGDDKQELERQRLLALASSPGDAEGGREGQRGEDQEGGEEGERSTSVERPAEGVPSAPTERELAAE